jgi:hypothetical protein
MKIMMLSLILILLSTSNVFSECIDYDFAELNKMTEQQMISAYENNREEKLRINQEALGKETTSSLSSEVRTKMIDCDNYSDRIMRAFKSKFPGKNLRKAPANKY